MKKILALILIMFVFTLSISPKIPPDAELLGVRAVNFRAERDEIVVTAYEGFFRKIAFKVSGNSVEIFKLVVVYGNGDRDEIPVKWLFKKGDWSRIIDLEGNRRIIRKIIFFYRSVGKRRRGKAEIRVLGIR